jgi:hypothetical protein
MANEVTTNIGMELPTPGVTGALGVEIPGASWMELQNEAFRKVDAHNHGGAGGAPIDASALLIAADVSFNGYRAIDLGSAQFIAGAATAAARSIFFYNGDFWISNGSAVPVRLTNGASIAAAAGNITGLSGSAAITWNSGLGVFIFESTSGTKAGIYCGPLSIFEPVSGGKKVTFSAPAGLAADYALTFPAALPGAKMGVFVSAAGALTFEALGSNIGAGSITKAMQILTGPVSAVQTPGVQSVTATAFTDIANVAVSNTTAVTDRPVLVSIQSDPSSGETLSSFLSTGAGQKATLRLLSGTTTLDERSTVAEAAGGASCALPSAMVTLGAAGTYTLKLQAKVNTAGAGIAFQNLKIVAYEL